MPRMCYCLGWEVWDGRRVGLGLGVLETAAGVLVFVGVEMTNVGRGVEDGVIDGVIMGVSVGGRGELVIVGVGVSCIKYA